MTLPMKYVACRYRYEASNVTFNPNDMTALSYGWWQFLMRVDGIIYLNTYRYSRTTLRHISKVSSMLTHLGIPYKQVRFKQSMYCSLTPKDLADWTAAQTLADIKAKDSKRLARNELARINRANLKAEGRARMQAFMAKQATRTEVTVCAV